MTVFREDKLEFQFNENWDIRQYDKHFDFTKNKHDGEKAVDFTGEWLPNRAVFIEVKDFFNRPESQRLSILQKVGGSEPPLVEAIVQKMEDTRTGIQRLKTDGKTEPLFWQKMAARLANFDSETHLILWLELPHDFPKGSANVARNTISTLLKQRLLGRATNVAVFDLAKNPFAPSLIVRRITN